MHCIDIYAGQLAPNFKLNGNLVGSVLETRRQGSYNVGYLTCSLQNQAGVFFFELAMVVERVKPSTVLIREISRKK